MTTPIAHRIKTSPILTLLVCTALLLASFMAFGKHPLSWYYRAVVDTKVTATTNGAQLNAVFVGDDFDPSGSSVVLQKQQQPNLQSYLRATKKRNIYKPRREDEKAEELMYLNLLVGQ